MSGTPIALQALFTGKGKEGPLHALEDVGKGNTSRIVKRRGGEVRPYLWDGFGWRAGN